MLKNPDQEQSGTKLKKGRQFKGHTGNLQNSGGKVSSFIKDLVQHTLYHTYDCPGTTWKKPFSDNTGLNIHWPIETACDLSNKNGRFLFRSFTV